MAERFERLYKSPDNLYINESPIIMSAGALLKDSQTGSVVVQLKFHSVSENTIKAVKVSLSAFDVSGTEIQGVKDYQYLDLNIHNGQEFGSNKAIVMPSTVTRSFSISDITVVFSSGSQWKCDDTLALASLQQPKYLSTEFHDAEIEKQYVINTNSSAKYVPTEAMSLWNCACGEWNKAERCTKCGLSKRVAFSALDINALKADADKRISAEQAKREEDARIAAEEEAKRRELEAERQKAAQKRNKIIAIIGTPVLAVVLLFVLYINPYVIKYSKAVGLIENEQYEAAYELFSELKTYKDSELYFDAFEWVCIEEYASGDYLSRYEYDDTGKLISHSKEYYEYETLDTTYDYSYDDSGKLLKVTKKDDDGEIDSVTTYSYTDGGMLSEEHDDWTYFEYLTKYSYDKNGYLVYEEYFRRDKDEDPDFVVSMKTTYVNDDEGKVIEKTVIDDEGKETKYKYTYDENGLCTEWERLSDQKTYKYDRTFDDYGRVVSCIETRLDGSTQKITYKYDLVFHSEKLSVLTNPEEVYGEAEQLLADGQYDKAIQKFKSLGDYKDSNERINAIYELIDEEAYSTAVSLLQNGQYEEAITAFENLGDYKDSVERIKEAKYAQADYFLSVKQYDNAIAAFEALGAYKDSSSRVEQAKKEKYPAEYANAEGLVADGKSAEAAIAFGKLGAYSDAAERSLELWQSVAQRSTLAAGQFSTLGITSKGSVVVVGGSTKYDFSQWTNIVSVCGGDSHYIGLKADGTVIATGFNADGQCEVADWKNIVSISAGSSHTVGLKSDGTVIAVGNNESGQCDVSEWSDIIAISTGDFHTVGIKSNGTVVAVGNNGDGQCEVSGWKNIVSISAGIFHTVGLKSDGTVVATGDNSEDQCQVEAWADIVSITAGRQHTVGLKSDGTLVVAGNRWADECKVSSWENIVDIGAGNWHTVGLTENGTVIATGSNKYGQCDVDTWTNIRLPN